MKLLPPSLGIPAPSAATTAQTSASGNALGVPINPHLVDLLTRIVAALGASGSSISLSLVTAVSAPPLPNPHVSRGGTFAELERLFKQCSELAVVGYPKCGKTVAVAEYVQQHNWKCIWLTAPHSSAGGGNWLDVASFQIGQFLGSPTLDRRVLQDALVSFSAHTPLVIVIDDAHLIDDLASLEFLEQAAAASQGQLRLVLVAVDRPTFLAAVRSAGGKTWRLPGFTEKQATVFYKQLHGALTALQGKALTQLVVHTHGHPGMLRLAHAEVRKIQSRQDFRRFIQSCAEGTSPGLETFQAGLIQRLRALLKEDELELCRRVTIALRPFAKRLGQALWSVDRSPTDFGDVWERCILRAFDEQRHGRFALPELYKQGLLGGATQGELAKWHSAAADVLAEPEVALLNVFDVRDVVIHRLLAGDLSGAMNDAARFLAHADESDSERICAFLIHQFESWLGGVATDLKIAWASRVRWHAMRTKVYRQLRELEKAAEAAKTLRALVVLEDAQGDRMVAGLGWGMLLLHAASTADVELAVEAAETLADAAPKNDREFLSSRHGLVLSAFLTSQSNPLPYVEKMLREQRTSSNRLWDEAFGFDVWRTVGAAVYNGIEAECGDTTAIAAACQKADAVATVAIDGGEPEIGLVLRSFVSRAQIDLLRDFRRALETALNLPRLKERADVRLRAFAEHTVGTGHRCAEEFSEAEAAYRKSATSWPASCGWEFAETLLMLGICVARQGRHAEAQRFFWNAGCLYDTQSNVPSFWRSAAGAFLEAASASLHAGLWTSALRALVRCHALLHVKHRATQEWITTAQLAWVLADHPSKFESTPKLPFPGFTLGYRKAVVESEGMDLDAPTMMLGRACASCDAPNRALMYFDHVWENATRPESRLGVAMYGLDAALAVGRFASAVRFGFALGEGVSSTVLSDVKGFSASVLEHQMAGIVRHVVDCEPDADEVKELRAAAALAQGYLPAGNAATSVLKEAVIALVEAIVEGNASGLDGAYVMAATAKGVGIARLLSWYFTFRFPRGRPVQRRDLLLWQWRLAWLSLESGKTDPEFLKRFAAQEYNFWQQVAESETWEGARELADALTGYETEPQGRITAFRDVASRLSLAECGAAPWIRELTVQLQVVSQPQWLLPSWEHAVAKLANFVFSPVASEFVEELSLHVRLLKEAIATRLDLDVGLAKRWEEDIADLATLIEMVQRKDVGVPARDALLRMARIAGQLSAVSAAHYYVLLRHSIAAGLDENVIRAVQKIVSSDHPVSLLKETSVPEAMRVRLSLAMHSAMGSLAVAALQEAVASLHVQEGLKSPIRVSARDDAKAEFAKARDVLKSCIDAFDTLEKQCCEKSDLRWELSSVYFERGGLRKLIAATLKFQKADALAHTTYLKPAAEDMRAAITSAAQAAASPLGSLQLRAAFDGQVIAEVLEDKTLLAIFEEVISAHRDAGGYADEFARHERTEDSLRIVTQKAHTIGALRHADEKTIQHFTDSLMKATGYPPSRRRHVEDDVRKMARIEEVKSEYCQYLEPLQNLIHTRSPATIYAAPTEYVCTCSLLGHETQIECADIDAVIEAMKRVYCSSCDKRSPLPS